MLTWVTLVNNTHVHDDLYAAADADTVLSRPTVRNKHAQKPYKIPLEILEALRVGGTRVRGSTVLRLRCALQFLRAFAQSLHGDGRGSHLAKCDARQKSTELPESSWCGELRQWLVLADQG